MFNGSWGYSPRVTFVSKQIGQPGRVGRIALLAILLLFSALPQAYAAVTVGATPGDFSVSPSGAATYSIPIAVPPGTAGMAPKLVLGYSSQSGNGLAGSGWSLSGLSAISRCPSSIAQDGLNRGIQDDVKDKFCVDGQRLIAVNGVYGADGTEYRTEIESFTRIISHGASSTGPQWFEAWTKSGQHMEYGNTLDANVKVSALVTGGVTPTIAWAINKSSDTAGNYLSFSYTDDPANSQFYPREIDYTGNASAIPALAPYNKVTFSYAARASNPPAVYLNGYKSQITQRLTAITTWVGAIQARTYALAYPAGDFLGSVTESDGVGGNNVNPTTFTWQYPSGSGDFEATQPTISGTDLTTAWFASSGDVNGDGYDDLLTVINGGDGKSHLLLRVANGASSVFSAPVDVGITTVLRDCSIVANCAEKQIWTPLLPPPEVSILGDVNGDGQADLILGDGRVALGQANGSFGTPYPANVQIGAAPGAAAKDINGDGYADLLYAVAQSDNLTHYYVQYAIPPSQPGGQVTFANPVQVATAPLVPLYTPGSMNLSTSINEPCVATLGDVNGDGRADIITCTGHVYLAGDNNAFTDVGVWGQLDKPGFNYDQAPGTSPTPGYMSTGDINGDGLSDVLSGTYVVQGFSLSSLDIAKPDGHLFGTPIEETITAGADFASPTLCVPVPYAGLVAGNFTGRGRADALEFNYSSASTCNDGGQHNPTATLLRALVNNAPVITGVTDGLGASRTITYSALNNSAVYTAATGAVYPNRNIQPTASALYVVSATSANNGIGGNFVLNYSYTDARVDAHGRGFLGFHIVTAVDSQSAITTATTYNQDFPLTGTVASMVKTVQNSQNQTVRLSGVYSAYGVLDIPATPPATGTPGTTCPSSVCTQYPYLFLSVANSKDLDGSALPYVMSIYGNPDWYGNVGTITVSSPDGYTKTTTNTYANDATHWLLGRLTQSQMTSTMPQGSSSWSLTRTSAFKYDPTTGFLTEESIEPNQAQYALITDYTYDAFGNRVKATVSGGSAAANNVITARTTQTTYDARGQFPVTVTNALNQSETRAYDARFGTLTSLTGPNGLTTTWSYDGFGRKLLEQRADGTSTTWSYLACTSGLCTYPLTGAVQLWSASDSYGSAITPAYAVASQSTGSAPVMSVYDNLKRPVRSVSLSPDGTQMVYRDTQYNVNGWVTRTSLPYFAWNVQAVNSVGIDASSLGMYYSYGSFFTSVFAPYQSSSTIYWNTTSYDTLGRPVSVSDPAGHASTMAYYGLTTVASNALSQTKTEVKNSQGQTVSVTDTAGNTLTYSYDPFGDLANVTDPMGHTTASLYDIRGHKFLSSDPDAGVSSYTYDPLGELRSVTDAKYQTTTYTYDLLGRMIQRNEAGITSYWVYDLMSHGIGKLAYSYTSVGNTHIYNYDNLSRPIASWLLTSTSTLGITRTYDAVGRVATQAYPDGFALKKTYNAQGALAEVDPVAGTYSGTNTYLWKALAWDAAGHVTQEQFGNGVTTTHSFDPATLRQTAIAAGTGNAVMNQTYSYDALGNTTTRIDPLAGTSEIYSYDNINRLTQDATTLTSSCSSNCTSSVTVAYDALGNITSKSDVGAYTYTDPSHIHAVTQAGANTYSYDANGNLMAGGGRSATWMASNLPASVTQNGQTTSWAYDADHNRVTQTEPGKTTIFLNPRIDLGMHYEQVTYSGGRIDQIHILYAGAEVIGQYTTTNQSGVPPASTRYFGTDPLGSVVVLTNETGVVTDRYAYDPWGKQRVISGSSDSTDTGFTGQEQLAVGLVQLNGRLYDPVLGRMVSADPIIANTQDLQSYNGYTYVMNNPLGYTDPSGLCWAGCFWQPKHWGPVGRAIAIVVIAYFVGPEVYNFGFWGAGGTALGAGASATTASLIGGVAGSALEGAVIGGIAGGINGGGWSGVARGAEYGALTAGAFNVAGDVEAAAGWNPGGAGAVFTHALVGGVTNAAGGGSFKDGLLSAGFAEAAGPALGNYDNVFTEAVVGGTASVLGGGKFANGAETAAFAYVFNRGMHDAGRAKADSIPDAINGYRCALGLGGCIVDAASICITAACVDSQGKPFQIKYLSPEPRITDSDKLYPPPPSDMPQGCQCTKSGIRSSNQMGPRDGDLYTLPGY